jgi:ribosome maturation factor RimP
MVATSAFEIKPRSLKNPAELSSDVHKTIFCHLAALVQDTAKQEALKETEELAKSEWNKLRLRDWQMARREGNTILDVFLDKGHSWLQYDDFAERPGHKENLSIVTIEECLRVHKAILRDLNFCELFGDHVVFEVGSAGEEPPLRFAEDFMQATGLMIALETWTKTKNRDRQTFRLVAVLGEGTNDPNATALSNAGAASKVQVIDEKEMIHTYDISDIRHASLLLFHPGNFKK